MKLWVPWTWKQRPPITVIHVERRPRPSIDDALHRKLAAECGYVRRDRQKADPQKD